MSPTRLDLRPDPPENMDPKEFREIVAELRSNQIDLLKSTTRTEGWMEATKSTLDAINATLADVGSVRQDLATLMERDKHSDPLLLLMEGEVKLLKQEIESMKKAETRKWVEGIAKGFLAGGAGGAVALLSKIFQ